MPQALVGEPIAVVAGTPTGRISPTYRVWYTGNLPDGRPFDEDVVTVLNLDISRQPAQIDADIAAAVRTRAASIGINVGNGEVIIHGTAKG